MGVRARKLLLLGIKLLIGLILIANVVIHYPTLRALGFALSGKSQCSPWQVMKGQRYLSRRNTAAEEIARGMRLVRSQESYRLWETRSGAFWAPARTGRAFVEQLAEQEYGLYSSGRHSVRPGDVVLDCGASLGAFTRTALSAGAATVVAIEPAPDVVESLRRTFANEIKTGQVIVYPKGVWDKKDRLALRQSENSIGDSVVVKVVPPSSVEIELTTIDDLVAELKLPRVDFIKMDIEGAEKQALAGGRSTIRRFRPRLAVASNT